MARVVIKETQVFTFDELSDSAKETARDEWLALGDYWSWQSEWWASAQAFCDVAPVTLTSADYDRADITATFDEPNACYENPLGDLSGVRAWKWLQNNGWLDLAAQNARGGCTLTGYCGDCPLFDEIAKLAGNPAGVPDLQSLFVECLQDWVIAARRDLEGCQTLEYFTDMCEANDWEFDENGRFYVA